MKKMFVFALGAVLMFNFTASAHEQTSQVTVPEITEAGVFVNTDEGSATGYTVTFVYESADAQSVSLDMGDNLYLPGGVPGIVPEDVYTPYEWQDGMFGVGYEGYTVDLEKVEGTDFWTVSLPLAHALHQYNYVVDGEPANDPTNPWAENPNNGDADGDCTVYVPLDPEKAPSADDYSYLDRETVTQPGDFAYVEYTDVNGDTAPLGVYLPYGYDAEREEPYKVVYVSHGYGASEVNWIGCGHMDVEYDHMIEDGLVEPCIAVTMNNTNYSWDYDVIIDNLMNHIIPYMEENYNVSSEASGRAFCGLSMGGMTTSHVLYDQAENFGYFGLFSGADSHVFPTDEAVIETLKAPVIMIGAGCYDFGLERYVDGKIKSREEEGFNGVNSIIPCFEENGIEYGYEVVNGGHDWYAWPQLMYRFATKYLWK